VEFVRSAEVNPNNVGGSHVEQVSSSDVEKNISQSTILDNRPRGESDGKGVKIAEYGLSLLEFNTMKYVFENYTFGDDGNVVSRSSNGNYKLDGSRSLDSDKNPRQVEATIRLNKIWINSYQKALGGAMTEDNQISNAFMGEATATNFNLVITALRDNCKGMPLSEISKFMFDKFGFDQPGFVKTMLYFITNPEISILFDFQMDISPDVAIQKYEQEKANDLKESLDDVMVMVKNPPKFY